MRTVIMADRNTTIDPHDLERFVTITLVDCPVGSKETALAWAWKLGPKLKSVGGGPARF
jgi:hypothetical protein